jgi:hypothetical protein
MASDFIDCTFDNVTFDYEGTAPFEFDPPWPTMTGTIRISGTNEIVKQTMNMCFMRDISKGCGPHDVRNESPDSPR